MDKIKVDIFFKKGKTFIFILDCPLIVTLTYRNHEASEVYAESWLPKKQNGRHGTCNFKNKSAILALIFLYKWFPIKSSLLL